MISSRNHEFTGQLIVQQPEENNNRFEIEQY